MEASLVSVLPNLSIGVVSVLCLVFITHKFLKELSERETAMRAVEKEIRTSIMNQLAENTATMKEIVSIHNMKR